jgi:hypothetical protein
MIDALIHIVFDQLTLRVSPAPSLRPLIYLRPVLYRLALWAAFSGLDDTPPPGLDPGARAIIHLREYLRAIFPYSLSRAWPFGIAK